MTDEAVTLTDELTESSVNSLEDTAAPAFTEPELDDAFGKDGRTPCAFSTGLRSY
jgi:hypothetical protein